MSQALAIHEANGHHKAPLVEAAPPHDDALEAAVLEGLLKEPRRVPEVQAIITEADFFSDANRLIFRHIVGACVDGEPDMTKVVDGIRNNPADANLIASYCDGGWVGYVAGLYQGTSPGNATFYASRVAELSQRRRLKELGVRLQQAAHGPHDVEAAISDARAALDEFNAYGADTKRPAFNKITAQELAAGRYDLNFIIDDVLVDGQPAGIIGPQKTLKTSLICDMAIAIDQAGFFLGKFPVREARRVCVISAESGWSTLQETCLRICRAAGRELGDTGIIFSDTLPRLGDPAHMRELAKFFEGEGTQVAFFDPLYLMLMTGGDESSIFAMGALLREIADLCHALNVTPVFAHHSKRGVASAYAPGELSDASWAGISEFLRQWILLNRRAPYEPGSGVHQLWFSVGGSCGHGDRWGLDISEGTRQGGAERFWDVQLLATHEMQEADSDDRTEKAEQKQRAKIDAIKQKIVRVMVKYPAGDSMTFFRNLAGASGTIAAVAFSELFDDGQIEHCEVLKGNRKTPMEGIRIKPSAEVV